ncbi:hypothetical protein AADX40_15485 [Aeromonas veronii]|uniref:hypothetical protein n=1 Tax=Aeromonas TaxID=642 RepID=UPI0031588A73
MSEPLKAHELVQVVAGLVRMPTELLAQIANVPANNLATWLQGKKQNLLSTSIRAVLRSIGIEIGAEGAYLSADRVHYWHLDDRMFGQRKGLSVYRQLTLISKMLTDCQITEVLMDGTKAPRRGCRYFMLSKRDGSPVRLVIRVNVGMWRKPQITPDVIRGAMWRDESDEHVVHVIDPVFWSRVVTRDLTIHEFDWIFTGSYDSTSWADVGLAAREAGVRPHDLMGYIHQKAEFARKSNCAPSNTNGVMVLQDNVTWLHQQAS